VAKKATRRLIRCCSAGVMRSCKSARSVEKSTSSTVHVFLMAAFVLFVEDRVLHRPESQIKSWIENHQQLLFKTCLLARVARFRVFERASDGHRGGNRDCCLGDFCRRTGTQVVGCLEAFFPGIHVHGRKFSDIRALDEQVERLALSR
jgi:hypothetical protein